jgi:putative ABC transport system permease protein
MKSRLGADLIVVPLEYDRGMEAILIKGEPSCFYFNRSVQEKISHLDGISQISSQFFLTSLSADCCDLPIQLIAFDPETDFTIQPWIAQVYSDEIAEGTVIIGSDIIVDNDSYIKLYDENYKIAAKMEKTGTGLDQTVFTNMKTMEKLFEGAKRAGLNFLGDVSPKYSISSVLLKAEENYDRKTLVKDIRKELGGVQIIETQSMITKIADNLESFAVVIRIFAVLFFGVAFITLLLMFSIIANERKKEFAVLRTLGATRGKLTSTLLLEALYISSSGGIIGTLSSAVIVLSFHAYISARLGLPYLQPDAYIVAAVFIVTFLAVSSIGPLASVCSAVKISRQETYLTLREGE